MTSIHPSIKSWPESERPRERLFAKGIESLSDAELIALLLRTGIQGKDVLMLSRELIKTFGGLRGLLRITEKELNGIKGLGPAKITTFLAVSELSKRMLREDLIGKHYIRDPESVTRYLTAALCDRKKEIFKVLFLDKAYAVTGERDLFEGTVDEAFVWPREILKAGLDAHATGIVLVHNHPSGRTEPSREDCALTDKIKLLCETVSMELVDHLIVGDNRLFSFREQGLLS